MEVVVCLCKLTLIFLAQANNKDITKEMRRILDQTE